MILFIHIRSAIGGGAVVATVFAVLFGTWRK